MNLPEQTFGGPETGVQHVTRRCAYGLIVRDFDLLLIVSSNGGWFFPGGGVEPHETRAEGLIREIREEIGCASKVAAPFARAKQYVYSGTEQTHFELHATYHAAVLEGFIESTGEHPAEWVPIERASAMMPREADAWALASYRRR